jgi:hypothetical protein
MVEKYISTNDIDQGHPNLGDSRRWQGGTPVFLDSAITDPCMNRLKKWNLLEPLGGKKKYEPP